MTEPGDLEAKLGHRFTHPELLEEALTHGSVRHEQQTGDTADSLPGVQDNERLEFLGDAIVGMLVAELLYRRYPELHEGELTRLRSALVSRRHLGLVGTGLELGRYLRLGRAEERNGGRKKAVLLANCMEALIGALYLEGGLAVAANFVERTIVHPYMDGLRGALRENRAIGDYKTALQELLQARRAGQPEYIVEAETGPDHRKRFLIEARVSHGPATGSARGEGSNKKRAEQEAARQLYDQLTGRSEERDGSERNQASPERNADTSTVTTSRPQQPAPERNRHPRPAESKGPARHSKAKRPSPDAASAAASAVDGEWPSASPGPLQDQAFGAEQRSPGQMPDARSAWKNPS
jgi:ribonuclease-3